MPEIARPLRIAEVLPSGVGPYSGITTVVLELAHRLAASGHEVELWPLSPWDERERAPIADKLAEAGIAMVDGFPSLPKRLVAFRNRPVDVVHLHSVFTAPNTFLARLLRVPYVLTPHGGYNRASLHRSALRKRIYGALLERRTVANAAKTVALTEVERDDIAHFAPRASTAVIHNGVTPPSGSRSDGRLFRKKFGIGEDTPLLIFVGRLDIRHKGLDFLVDALSDAPKWSCALVGPDAGGTAAALRKMAEEKGVSDRLLIIGPAHGDELSDALATGDLFVLLSRWEGLPMSLLEAASHGLPSIVSNEVERLVPVAAAGAGWAVEASAAGRVLNELSNRGILDLSRESEAALNLAARYDWDSVAEAYGEVFQDVVRA